MILLTRARVAERLKEDVKRSIHDTEMREKAALKKLKGGRRKDSYNNNGKKGKDKDGEDAVYDNYGKAVFRYGRSYEKARVGFFCHSSTTINNANAWHQYAVCMFLVFNNFEISFEAFVRALQLDTGDLRMRANFDVMMRHFHGEDKDYVNKIKNENALIIAQKVSC